MFNRATSVACPTKSPSSLRVALALLHRAPTSRVFRKAGEIRVGGAGDEGSMRTSSSTVYNSVIVCSFRVSVPEARQSQWKEGKRHGTSPVLSEQITEMEPSASTEWSFLTIALCFAMRNTPRASVTVVTTGRPSGMAATANDTMIEEDKSITRNHQPKTNLQS